ncbi:hypothetical protein [Clostridium formicaceticum]|nr:hypothetical protein [Clostridium formicaceticum]
MKNQEETPYTPFGRGLFERRTKKTPLLARAEELMELSYSRIIAGGKKEPHLQF